MPDWHNQSSHACGHYADSPRARYPVGRSRESVIPPIGKAGSCEVMGARGKRRTDVIFLPLSPNTMNPTDALAQWFNAYARTYHLWSRWLDRVALELWGM